MKWLSTLAAIFLVALSASADYRDEFRAGIKAKDQGNWSEVERRMRAAIAEKSEEGERLLIYGTRREIYLPHYYLGLAYQKVGNCDGANQEWDLSVQQGVIRDTNLFRELEKLRALCPPRKQPEPPMPATRVTETKPVVKPPAEPPQPATQAVEPPRVEDRRVTAVPTPASDNPLLVEVRMRAAEARSVARFARNRRDLPADVVKAVTELEQLIAATRSLASRSDNELAGMRDQLTARSARLEATLQVLPSPTVSPPVNLLVTAAAFFSGDHQRVLDNVAKASFTSPKAAAHGYLFASASAFSLWVLGGSRSNDLRTRAVSEARSARSLDPTVQPKPEAFSPRYVAFFEEATQ